MGGAVESVTTILSEMDTLNGVTMRSAGIVFTRVFRIRDALNQATASPMAVFMAGDGSSMLMRKRTRSALSLLQMEGGSNLRAQAGLRLLSSYCWHQAVGLPVSLIWVFRIHSIPF